MIYLPSLMGSGEDPGIKSLLRNVGRDAEGSLVFGGTESDTKYFGR